MKWSVTALLFTFALPRCQGNEETDEGSLLQVHHQNKQRAKAGTWQVSKQISNGTAKCSCFAVGCPLSMCMQCPELACACSCTLFERHCKCCDGDRDCIAKKIEELTNEKIMALEEDETYNQAMDRFRRQGVLDVRVQENQDWKHQEAQREHQKLVRQDEDDAWEKVKIRHKRTNKEAKERRKEFKKYVKDLSGVVDGVLHEMEGGQAVVMAPFIEPPFPDCDCGPPMRCPPEPGCPVCQSRCPPCRPCTHHMECESSCPEDDTIKEYVHRFMEGHSWALIADPVVLPLIDEELDWKEPEVIMPEVIIPEDTN